MPIDFRAEAAASVPPEQVWAVLADLHGWSTWNSVEPAEPGPLAVGAPFPLWLHVAGRRIRGAATIVRCEPGRSLVWQGGVRGLFLAVHGFDLVPTAGGCTIVHHERFTGPLAPLFLRLLGPGHAGRYAQIAERLAARAAARLGAAS